MSFIKAGLVMKQVLQFTCILVVSTLVVAIIISCKEENSPIALDVKYLAEHENTYYGKNLSVHACMTVTMHGAYIHPCGSCNPRYFISLDTSEATASLITDEFSRLELDFASEIEANLLGHFNQRKTMSELGKSRVIPVLELQKIQDPVEYESEGGAEKSLASCLSH